MTVLTSIARSAAMRAARGKRPTTRRFPFGMPSRRGRRALTAPFFAALAYACARGARTDTRPFSRKTLNRYNDGAKPLQMTLIRRANKGFNVVRTGRSA